MPGAATIEPVAAARTARNGAGRRPPQPTLARRPAPVLRSLARAPSDMKSTSGAPRDEFATVDARSATLHAARARMDPLGVALARVVREKQSACGDTCECASCSTLARSTLARSTLARESSAPTVGAGVPGPCPDVEPRPHPKLLQQGSHHSAVREAQRKLNLAKTGDASGPLSPDCLFGPLTAAAVREFQKAQFGDPKEADGMIGPKTWAKLDAVVPGPKPPVPPPSTLNVKVPQHIRGDSSPAAMNDRIPPNKDTAVQVDISGVNSGDPPVIVSVSGTGGGNGTVTIDGAATKSMTASGTIKLRGGTQTDVGKAGGLKLVASQGTTEVTSAGFSVSAIPQNYSDTFVSELTGNRRGFIVQDGWESDSGTFSDLDQTEISERVEETKATGCFAGVGSKNSDYLAGNSLTKDTHSSPTASLTSTGERIAQQTCMFKDKRSGSTDIPMTNSGYELVRVVTTRFFGLGGFNFHITKNGKSTTARGITSNAGVGSIDKTQKV